MSAVLDVVEKPSTADGKPKRRVGWPLGKPRGPRKKPEGEVAVQPVKAKRPRKPASGEIAQGWLRFQRECLNKRGEATAQARRAYHAGVFDMLMLLGTHVGAETLPPAFLQWVQQCNAGLLAKD